MVQSSPCRFFGFFHLDGFSKPFNWSSPTRDLTVHKLVDPFLDQDDGIRIVRLFREHVQCVHAYPQPIHIASSRRQ
jgi:hypothetical protein